MGEAQEKRPLLPEWALATAAREIGGLTAAATLLQHGGAGCALVRPDSAGLLPGKGEGIIGQKKRLGQCSRRFFVVYDSINNGRFRKVLPIQPLSGSDRKRIGIHAEVSCCSGANRVSINAVASE